MVDLIVGWVADAIGEVFDQLIALFAPLLGFNFQKFVNVFPYSNTVYVIFQRCGLVLILIISVVQLFSWFFPSDPRAKQPPLRIAYGAILAVGFIYFGNYLLEGIIDLCVYPYEAIRIGETQNGLSIFEGISLTKIFETMFGQYTLVVYCILFGMIGIAFLKLMLEAVERYLVLFLLIYASPLASATLVSDMTNGVYKQFFKMFISQCLLMILNIWILKLTVSMFTHLDASDAEAKVITLLMGWGMLKIGARLDSYINQLGLNAAVTGVGLAAEIGSAATGLMMMAGMTVRNVSGGKSTGGLKGLWNKWSKGVDLVNPYSVLTRGVANYGGGLLRSTVGQDGMVGAAINRIKGNPPAPKGTWQQNLKKNMHEAGLKTQEQSGVARSLGSKNRAAIVDRYTHNHASSADREDTAKYSHLADQVFRSASAGELKTDNAKDIGAVMQGIGFENTQLNAGEYISAAYGNSRAENVQFKMDKDGITASFEEKGKKNTATIIDKAKHQALPYEQQEGYTEFKSENGTPYYYKTSTVQLPTEAQAATKNFKEGVDSFVSSSTGTLSADNFAYISKHPAAATQIFDGLQENNVTINNQEQIGLLLQSMPTAGIPEQHKNDAVNALLSNNADAASLNGSGMSVTYTSHNGHRNTVTVLTEEKIQKWGSEYIADRGYTRKNINGRQYAFLFERDGDTKDYGIPKKPRK